MSSTMATIEVPDGGGSDLGKLEGQGATSADDMELVRLGKKPGMKRVYNFWTCMIDYILGSRIALTLADDTNRQCVPTKL